MADYLPIRGQAYTFYTTLASQADSNLAQVNPTLAVGDVKVSLDGGVLANLTALPVVEPAGSAVVKVALSAAEMTADNVVVHFHDAAGAQWADLTINLQPTYGAALISATTSYATVAEIKTALGETASTYDTQIALAIAAAGQAIDEYCHRTFAGEAGIARYFTAISGQLCPIDDLQALTTLETDDSADSTYNRTWAASDYVLRPRNKAPKTSLHTAPGGRYSFPLGQDAVKVTGDWGYGSVPDSVHQFCILYAMRLFLRKDAPFGVAGGSEIGQSYIPKNDPDARMLLNPHVRSDQSIGVW
jgi:hypothetical protein